MRTKAETSKKTPLPAKRPLKPKKKPGKLDKDGLKVAASFTIHRASEMTQEGRDRIEDWIRNQAQTLRDHGGELSKTYRARYLYRTSPEKDGGGEDGGLDEVS